MTHDSPRYRGLKAMRAAVSRGLQLQSSTEPCQWEQRRRYVACQAFEPRRDLEIVYLPGAVVAWSPAS